MRANWLLTTPITKADLTLGGVNAPAANGPCQGHLVAESLLGRISGVTSCSPPRRGGSTRRWHRRPGRRHSRVRRYSAAGSKAREPCGIEFVAVIAAACVRRRRRPIGAAPRHRASRLWRPGSPQVSDRAGPGDEQQPLERGLRRRDAEPGGCLDDHQAGEHGVVLAAGPAERAERHERDSTAEALLKNGAPQRKARWNRFCTQTMSVPAMACRNWSRLTLLSPTPAMRPSSRAATIAASWSSKRASTRPPPGRRRLTAASWATRKLRRLSSMPLRSWCGAPDGRTAPPSSGRTATLLTIASPSG